MIVNYSSDILLIKLLFLGWRKSDQESESPHTIPSVHQVTDNNSY